MEEEEEKQKGDNDERVQRKALFKPKEKRRNLNVYKMTFKTFVECVFSPSGD